LKGIILHGGHGTRLRPLTHTGPKQLLPIANKPMSQFCLESMRDCGVTEIMIVIGGVGSEKVKEFYGDGKEFGVKIEYVKQEKPSGIAHAINLCNDFIKEEKFLVFLGDNIIQKSLIEYKEKFEKSNDDAFLLLCKVNNPTRFGIANIENDKIVKIEEKPKQPDSDLAVTGIYFLTPKIFPIIRELNPSWRNELEITDALQELVKINSKISYGIISEYWKDTGTPEDIIHANNEILKKFNFSNKGIIEDGCTIEGILDVGENTIIKSGTKIIGPVIIGSNCKISGNVIIGSNTSIGKNCEISKCNIQNSIIMDDCRIHCKTKINHSIISNNSSIDENTNVEERVFLLGEGTRIRL
jgi:glucose-1-phosphate thymidylyltransferase